MVTSTKVKTTGDVINYGTSKNWFRMDFEKRMSLVSISVLLKTCGSDMVSNGGPYRSVLSHIWITVILAIPELELGEFALEGQTKQFDEVIVPIVSEYVANPQSVHTDVPGILLYYPPEQAEHPGSYPLATQGTQVQTVLCARCVSPASTC